MMIFKTSVGCLHVDAENGIMSLKHHAQPVLTMISNYYVYVYAEYFVKSSVTSDCVDK